MNRRSKQARLLTGGLIGALPVTTPGDEHWDDVTLLLNGEANPIVDESSNSASTNVSVGTGVARNTSHAKFGNASMEFTNANADGTDNIEADIPALDGDYTIEFWIKGKATDLRDGFVFDTRTGQQSNTGITLFFPNNDNRLSYWSNNNGTNIGYKIQSGLGVISASDFDHVALVRSGAVVTLYLNGSSLGTYNEGTAISWPDSRWTIGTRYEGTAFGWSGLNAYLDDFRITKGVARYTSNFTPPTASLPTNAPIFGRRGVGTYDAGDKYWNDVSLLIRGDTLTDLSANSHTLTAYGNAEAGDADPVKFADGSLVFAGSGDYVEIADDESLRLGDGDFTLEFWIRPTNINYSGNSFLTPISKGYLTTGGLTIQSQNNNGLLRILIANTIILNSATALVNNTWQHNAICRKGSILRWFVNGALGSSTTDSSNFSSTAVMHLGQVPGNAASRFEGNIEDLRITKGVARYTSNFTPPTESFTTVLAGIPEATATFRTRGYVGAAPAGEEALWTPSALSFNPHSWIKADEGISNAGDGGTASVNAGWSDTDGTQNGLATKVNSGTTASTYISLPSSTNINTTFALVKGDAGWVSRAYAVMFSGANTYEHHGSTKVISYEFTTVETWRHTRENGEQIDWVSNNDWGTKTTSWRLYSLQSSVNDPWEFDRFGNDRSIAGRNFTGQLAELLTFEEELTEAEIEKIEGYLMHKWGLEANLPSLHPYKASAPTAIGPGVGMLTLYDRYVDRISANT